MKQEISFEERKRIQLEMLDEIDTFCRGNNIRYSIAFGTLLGAIRHKGFIPWDDDVDIMMPLPDLLKFKKIFRSKSIMVVDVDSDSTYEFPFPRLANINTRNKKGVVLESYGICIDLYVVVGIPKDYVHFFDAYTQLNKKRNFIYKWRNRLVRYWPIKSIPFFSKIQKQCRNYLFNMSVEYNIAERYYVIAGTLNLRNKMIYDRDIFASVCYLPFEDRQYLAITDWDYFLTLRYGDYMKLPPEDQRVPYHGGYFYWKY